MIFVIGYAILMAGYNSAVIHSYKTYDEGYKDLWHKLQALVVFYVIAWHNSGLNWLFLSDGIMYYCIFESALNLLMERHIFYVSKDGSSSDRIRYKIYGKHPQITEGIIKTILIFIALWLRQNQ